MTTGSRIHCCHNVILYVTAEGGLLPIRLMDVPVLVSILERGMDAFEQVQETGITTDYIIHVSC